MPPVIPVVPDVDGGSSLCCCWCWRAHFAVGNFVAGSLVVGSVVGGSKIGRRP